jgi:ATP phosphoribosyltransferase regulatory subunit HisZ
MSKFEEYDLYVRNKDFLVSESVITFNDTNGRLLALKPDVTLSIIKNSGSDKNYKEKLYYNENVYRISERTHQYKELMQTGIELGVAPEHSDSFIEMIETVYDVTSPGWGHHGRRGRHHGSMPSRQGWR